MTSQIVNIVLIVILAAGFLFYAFPIVIFTRGWFRLKNLFPDIPKPDLPTVSVIVPLRNEDDHLKGIFRQYLDQDYPKELTELILVDDHSSDETAESARILITQSTGSTIHLISLEEEQISGSKKNALTTGVKKATGELILTTDADCMQGKEWVKKMAFSYQQERKKLISGPVVIKGAKSSLLSCFEEFEFSSLVASGAGAIGVHKPIFCNGANMAYEKGAFLEVGGYEGNEKFASGDDVFLLHKIKKEFGPSSVGFVKDPEAIVTTEPASDIGSFIRQRVRWGAKSRGYKDKMAIGTALAVIFFNLALMAVFVYSGVRVLKLEDASLLLLSLLLAIILKSLVDLPLMWGMVSFVRRKKLFWGYPLYQLIYPFYIIITALGILFSRPVWKGRRIS